MTSGRLDLMLFTNSRVRGGVEEHTLTLLRGLDRERFRLHLVCSPEVAQLVAGDAPGDVDIVPLLVPGWQEPTGVRQLARLMRTCHVDILHSHQFRASLVASPLGRLCGVPVIVETPHIREHWRRGWLKSRFVVDRAVGRLVDYFIAVSESNGRYLIEGKGLPARKVVVIQNGCDLARCRWDRERAAELRARLGLTEADRVIITVGRLEPQKGHGILLSAMPALLREFPHLHLVCLGEGTLQPELERQAAQLGVERAVRFVGFQPDVASWLGMADVMALASFYEGLPLVAIEALAAGRAVVATAVDGTPEVVRDGVTGLTVAPGDATALAAAIGRLLRDRALRERLARQGQEWVSARFDQKRQVQETEQLYLRAWRERSGSKASAWPQAAATTGARQP
jgi:glycosyltransferase involved in cell wall biosynthesis